MATGLVRSLALLGVCAASTAEAQGDLFGIFGNGAETKAHAGAGQLFSREAPALYYNAANLSVVEGPEPKPAKGKKAKRSIAAPYFELDILSLTYTFQYPKSEDYDFDAVEVGKTTPVPFIGGTVRPLPKLAVAMAFLPLPGDSSSQKIEKLPSRDLAPDPILVDAETTGEGLGYRLALGGAWEILKGISAGASLLLESGKINTIAKSHEDGAQLLSDSTETSSRAIIVGARADLLNRKISGVFTLRLPETTKIEGETELAALPGQAVDKSGESQGPMGIGFGGSMKVWRELAPFLEIFYENWSALAGQEETVGIQKVVVAYESTLDIKLGADFGLGALGVVNGAFGLYPSHLGDGVMHVESDDPEEVSGMNFKTLDAMPYKVLSGGWRKGFLKNERLQLQTGVSYTFGSRTVAESARGYGDYELSIFQIIAGGHFRL